MEVLGQHGWAAHLQQHAARQNKVALLAVPDVLKEHLKLGPLGIMIQVQVYVPLPWDNFYAEAIPRISRLKFALGDAVA